MTSQIILYSHPMSRGRVVRWMLEEVGQPYDVELVGYGPAMKSEKYLAINPMGKVPALVHAGNVVTETAAICAYLADAFPDAGLAPAPASPGRAAYYRWLFFGAGPLEAAASNRAMGFEVPEDKRALMGYGSYHDVLATLEGVLEGRAYIAGEAFSAADVYVGSQLGFGMMFGTVEKRPAFEKYWLGLAARPAYQRAAQTDDALIAEIQAKAEG
jgi:glutathione S-transferase